MVACGDDSNGQCAVPPLEEGVAYTQVEDACKGADEHSSTEATAQRSDSVRMPRRNARERRRRYRCAPSLEEGMLGKSPASSEGGSRSSAASGEVTCLLGAWKRHGSVTLNRVGECAFLSADNCACSAVAQVRELVR